MGCDCVTLERRNAEAGFEERLVSEKVRQGNYVVVPVAAATIAIQVGVVTRFQVLGLAVLHSARARDSLSSLYATTAPTQHLFRHHQIACGIHTGPSIDLDKQAGPIEALTITVASQASSCRHSDVTESRSSTSEKALIMTVRTAFPLRQFPFTSKSRSTGHIVRATSCGPYHFPTTWINYDILLTHE